VQDDDYDYVGVFFYTVCNLQDIDIGMLVLEHEGEVHPQ